MLIHLFVWAALTGGLDNSHRIDLFSETNYFDLNLTQSGRKIDGAVIVHFWATWCLPCLEELPYLDFLNNRFKASNLLILAVSVDDNRESVVNFLNNQSSKLSLNWYLDPKGVIAKEWGSKKFPESYLFLNGKIVKKWVGTVRWSDPEIVALVEATVLKAE